MKTRYLIYCSAGAGGHFLTSVVSQMLGLDVEANFSSTGHAHDMGRGNWKGAGSICFIGDQWQQRYRPNFSLYYSHVMPDGFMQIQGDIAVIKITARPEDYRKITELYVKKAWPDLWTEEEYKKWVGPNYPPYSANNIQESELICRDLMDDLVRTYIAPWYEINHAMPADHEIDFRTVMGVDDGDLADAVSHMTGRPASRATREYIDDYQKINQELYFTDWKRS